MLSLGMMLLVASLANCDAGAAGAGEDDDSASGGTGGVDGHGGNTGGHAGGSGGASLCDQDCALIEAPACYKAVCNTGMHVGPVGSCVVVVDDGAVCDDDLFCTVDDTCAAGVCMGGGANDCGIEAPECADVLCDEDTDSCTTQPSADGDPCDTDDLCVVGSTCTNGLCAAGQVNDCFFAPVPNECYVAVCEPTTGDCEPVPGNEGGSCTDNTDLCSVNNTCSGGVCGSGTPLDCTHLTNGCDLGVCDPLTGQCSTMAVMNGQLCDDLDGCTVGEICTQGNCGGGSAVTTCELNGDNCCPVNCTAANDLDCQCMSHTLATPYNSNNGQNGNMFDIVALKGIEIQGFDVNIDTTATIEVYYRAGTWVGVDTSSAGWTLAGSASTTSAGADMPSSVPLTLAVQIPAGQTYAFYVTTTAGNMNYTNGTTVGSVAASNTDLQVLEGAGKQYPFSSTFQPRVWNGTIHYEQCGN